MTSLREQKNTACWTVGETEYANKIQAFFAAQQQNLGPDKVRFHYNDLWWDQADWTQEPNESLDELYVRRARQLREKYDTIIIRFSGGADSVNILRTFVDHDIKVDVVAMSVYSDGDPDWNIVPNNIEKKMLALPLIERLKDQGAEFRAVVSDYGDALSIIHNRPEWYLDYNAPRLSMVELLNFQCTKAADYKVYDNPSTCTVVGLDKPSVWCAHKKTWFWRIHDFLSHMTVPCNSMIPEPFYWSADMPEIPIKQSHVVKNFFKKHIETGNTTYTGVHWFCRKTQLIPLIYPTYFGNLDPLADKLPYYDMTEDVEQWKSQNGVGEASPLAMGTTTTCHLSPYYQTWVDGIDALEQKLQRRFKCGDSIWRDGVLPIYTKSRWLGK